MNDAVRNAIRAANETIALAIELTADRSDSAILTNVYPPTMCAGQYCVIHNPSNHRMRDWPLHWRNDRGIMERLCIHGIGHPDPDDVAYHMRNGDDISVHGCDGCCRLTVM